MRVEFNAIHKDTRKFKHLVTNELSKEQLELMIDFFFYIPGKGLSCYNCDIQRFYEALVDLECFANNIKDLEVYEVYKYANC